MRKRFLFGVQTATATSIARKWRETPTWWQFTTSAH